MPLHIISDPLSLKEISKMQCSAFTYVCITLILCLDHTGEYSLRMLSVVNYSLRYTYKTM